MWPTLHGIVAICAFVRDGSKLFVDPKNWKKLVPHTPASFSIQQKTVSCEAVLWVLVGHTAKTNFNPEKEAQTLNAWTTTLRLQP
jgi:hypothetical protein